MPIVRDLLTAVTRVVRGAYSTSGIWIRGGSISAGRDIVGGDVFYVMPSSPPITAPHQLWMPTPDFVGRKVEITKIEETVLSGKPAGIFGMGGIGKSELARVVADRLTRSYPDAQLFLDLQGTKRVKRKSEDALRSCISALKGPLPHDDRPQTLFELRELYLSALSSKRALVVLDDAANLDQVRPLTPPSGCGLIISSRSSIPLPGISALSLEELSPSEALELFLNIAQNVEEDVAAEICSLCGYLPLALRASASRIGFTPDLDPHEYATKLRDQKTRLELTANPEIGVSVEASLNMSYEFLTKQAARVFSQLATFPGPWDAAAEEVVCEDQSHKSLTKLVKESLVLYERSEGRYRLHDLVRLFAAVHLGNGAEFDAAQSRFCAYFTALVVKAVPPHQSYDANSKEFKQCKIEWHNIKAAQAWAADNIEKYEKAANYCIAARGRRGLFTPPRAT
jgi:predicted ATPase